MIIPSKAPVCLLSSLGFDLNFVHNSSNNQKPNVWLFWKNEIKALNVIAYSEQSISVIFYGHDESMLFSIIHAQTSLVKLIMGDFNVILLSSKKIGENPPNRTSCEEFANFVNSLDLMQPTREGIRYS
ncbi:hypothetical protein AMTRI_Chr04g183300 [Amborella trichopoda]